jgi:fluoroacetyl-CoA thioesterase
MFMECLRALWWARFALPTLRRLPAGGPSSTAENLLPEGHQSLGIHLDVSHTAATPVGLRVTATGSHRPY